MWDKMGDNEWNRKLFLDTGYATWEEYSNRYKNDGEKLKKSEFKTGKLYFAVTNQEKIKLQRIAKKYGVPTARIGQYLIKGLIAQEEGK